MPRKLGIIAGGGRLPSLLIEQCEDRGDSYVVVALKGQTAPETVDRKPHTWVRLGAAGAAVSYLRDQGVTDIVMVGAVTKPSAADLRPDVWTAKFLAATGAFGLGDDGLLRALIRHLEETEGFAVVGIHGLLPELLATTGQMTERAPDDGDLDDIDTGTRAAQDLGRRDLGQGVVVAEGRVLAREGRAGTDAMLAELAQDAADGVRRGILVKVAKPEQEQRADLPTIGPETVENARRAGLRGIAIEAGAALVVDKAATIAAADAADLFVIGVTASADRTADTPQIYLIAGEPSADHLGAHLMSALKAETDGNVDFHGVGGPAMTAEGLTSLFPMTELAVMGLAEVVPRIPQLLRRIRQTAGHARTTGPDVLISIDSPDFSFRVAKRLQGAGFPLVHFVAPSVWAWRPGRARKVAGLLDHLLTLLPFEPPYFEREGLATTYVGHPILESGADQGDGPAFRNRHGLDPVAPLLLILPGSRQGEVRRHLPIFADTVARLADAIDGLRVVTVTTPGTHDDIVAATAGWRHPCLVVPSDGRKFDAFAAADAALAASGSVALELAMSGTPAVIAYRMNRLTAWLAKRLVKVRFASLVNLILDRAATPEYLLDDCRADRLAEALAGLLADAGQRDAQTAAYGEALKILGHGDEPASRRAARAVLGVIEQAKKNGAA